MIVTNVMKEQMVMLENAIEGFIGNNIPPIAANFVFNSPMYNDYLGKVENVILMYMDASTGEVDGEKAHDTLMQMYPQLTKWVSVPRKNFFIKDEINVIGKALIGREVL